MEAVVQDDTRNPLQPQPLNHTKSGKALEQQAREVEEKRSARQREFARGEKRHTEGR
jgi:hypothetical protein